MSKAVKLDRSVETGRVGSSSGQVGWSIGRSCLESSCFVWHVPPHFGTSCTLTSFKTSILEPVARPQMSHFYVSFFLLFVFGKLIFTWLPAFSVKLALNVYVSMFGLVWSISPISLSQWSFVLATCLSLSVSSLKIKNETLDKTNE